MGVKPVDYNKPSSTELINQQFPDTDNNGAPNAVPINATTAQYVRKDADQGFCELDAAQEQLLGKYHLDNVEYTDEEMKNVGKNQIDTSTEDGGDISEKEEKTGAAKGVAVASATGAAASAAATIVLATAAKGLDAITGTVLGAIATAMGATCLAMSHPGIFDPNLKDRENKTANAASDIETINKYNDAILGLMTDMDNENATITKATNVQLLNNTANLNNIAALQAQLQVALKMGDPNAANLQTQIQQLSDSANNGPNPEVEGAKDRLLDYRAHVVESQGVKESADSVSEFLKGADQMIAPAIFTATMEMGAAVACACSIILPKLGIIDAALAPVATALFIAAGILFAGASVLMVKNSKAEVAAGKAGDDVLDAATPLGETNTSVMDYADQTESDILVVETKAQGVTTDHLNGNGSAPGKKPTNDPEIPTDQAA